MSEAMKPIKPLKEKINSKNTISFTMTMHKNHLPLYYTGTTIQSFMPYFVKQNLIYNHSQMNRNSNFQSILNIDFRREIKAEK